MVQRKIVKNKTRFKESIHVHDELENTAFWEVQYIITFTCTNAVFQCYALTDVFHLNLRFIRTIITVFIR